MITDLQNDDAFVYRSFYQNLSEKLSAPDVASLQVLGNDFFHLVDRMATDIFVVRTSDCFLLGLSLQNFLWELQIFSNRLIRLQCPSLLKLREFCQNWSARMQDERTHQQMMEEILKFYEDFFFVRESEKAALV